jgi:hypothetical protein
MLGTRGWSSPNCLAADDSYCTVAAVGVLSMRESHRGLGAYGRVWRPHSSGNRTGLSIRSDGELAGWR